MSPCTDLLPDSYLGGCIGNVSCTHLLPGANLNANSPDSADSHYNLFVSSVHCSELHRQYFKDHSVADHWITGTLVCKDLLMEPIRHAGYNKIGERKFDKVLS